VPCLSLKHLAVPLVIEHGQPGQQARILPATLPESDVPKKFLVPFFILVLSVTEMGGRPEFALAQGVPPATDTPLLLAQEAGDDLDCEDFDTQEEAQAVLEEDPADPHNLDPNGDGIACALLPAAADLASTEGDTAAQQETDTGNQTQEERRAARQAERRAQNEQTDETQEDSAEAVAPSCADFATAEEAQAAFDADPEGMAALDGDGNGIACEELLAVEPAADEEPAAERRRNRRNQEEEPAPVEVDVVVDEPEARRNRRNQEEEATPTEVVIDDPEAVRIEEDFDCIDFEFQEEAQAVYDQDPADPYNLDPNGDGFACSSLPSSGMRITQVPSTGAGTGSGAPLALLAAAGLLASLGAAAGTRRTIRR
jgi:hypothetical protein